MCGCEKNHPGRSCRSKGCNCHTEDWATFHLMVTAKNVPQSTLVSKTLGNTAIVLASDGLSFSYRSDRVSDIPDEPEDEEYHDDETIHKVYDALKLSGLTGERVRDAVSMMQNAGILFRERK